MKEFTKADLKDGMIVELRSEGLRLKIGEYIAGVNGHIFVKNYNNDLLHCENCDFDIIKIYRVKSVRTVNDIFQKDFLELIWERKEAKRMTVAEMRVKLEELTGEKIEVEPSVEEKFGIIVRHCDEGNGCESCCLKDMGLSTKCMFQDELFDIENIEQCYEKVMGKC